MFLCSWNSPGQNTGVSCHVPLQGTFPTQGSNPGLLHYRQILYPLSHQESPRRLKWIAYPSFMGSSWSRNRSGVSCITGGFFTSWATREGNKVELKLWSWQRTRWIWAEGWKRYIEVENVKNYLERRYEQCKEYTAWIMQWVQRRSLKYKGICNIRRKPSFSEGNQAGSFKGISNRVEDLIRTRLK